MHSDQGRIGDGQCLISQSLKSPISYLPSVYVQVYAYSHIYTYVYRCSCPWGNVDWSDINLKNTFAIASLLYYYYFLILGLSLNLELALLVKMVASMMPGSVFLHSFTCTGSEMHATNYAEFYMGSGYPNSSPQAWPISTFLIENLVFCISPLDISGGFIYIWIYIVSQLLIMYCVFWCMHTTKGHQF